MLWIFALTKYPLLCSGFEYPLGTNKQSYEVGDACRPKLFARNKRPVILLILLGYSTRVMADLLRYIFVPAKTTWLLIIVALFIEFHSYSWACWLGGNKEATLLWLETKCVTIFYVHYFCGFQCTAIANWRPHCQVLSALPSPTRNSAVFL